MNFDKWASDLADHVAKKSARTTLDKIKSELPTWDSGVCPDCLIGKTDLKQEPCYCAATHAPCGNCEDSWFECDDCGARSND